MVVASPSLRRSLQHRILNRRSLDAICFNRNILLLLCYLTMDCCICFLATLAVIVEFSLSRWPFLKTILILSSASTPKGHVLIRSHSLFVLDLNKVDVNVFVSFSNALFFLAFVISSRTTNENRTHQSTEPLAATNL